LGFNRRIHRASTTLTCTGSCGTRGSGVLAITFSLFLLSLTHHLIERLLVLDHCRVDDHLIQLKVPSATVFHPHLKTSVWHKTVLTRFMTLQQLTASAFLIKISGW
jgi:hypothetical protein